MTGTRESELFQLLDDLRARHAGLLDAETALRAWLRAARRAFPGTEVCLATWSHRTDGERRARIRHQIPGSATDWDLDLLAGVLEDRRTEPPDEVVVAPVRRRRRRWGVIALRTVDATPFPRGDGRLLNRLARALSDVLRRIDDTKARLIHERIERKIFERLRPKDVFYQILHGLRSLTRYDHSSALWIRCADLEFEVVAEQAAWTKTKSRRIGLKIQLEPANLSTCERGQVLRFEHTSEGFRCRNCEGADELAEALTTRTTRNPDAPVELELLVAPLWIRGRLLGLLQVAARTTSRLGEHEAELLRRFQLLAAVAVENSQATESLRQDVLRAERKHAMANVARGISHDVNNALGAILPLVQQLAAELEDDDLDVEQAMHDLESIETAVLTCRRVFAGLISFARSRERGGAHGDLRRAAHNAVSILENNVRRQHIVPRIDIPTDLPPVRGAQHELEQLVFNLASNACDAMPTGGRLEITARAEGPRVDLLVADDGEGMDAEALRRCADAFYTTRPHGNGLGLSICHSIVQDVRGRIRIDSEPGKGTRVHVQLPISIDPSSAEVTQSSD